MDSIRIVPDKPATPDATDTKNIVETANGVEVRPAGQEQQNAPGAEQRPTWLPDKFKSAEELAASYVELEKKLGQGKPADEPAAKPAAGQTPAMLDLSALAAEVAKDGKLGTDSLAKLKTAGIAEATVHQFIAGQQAVADKLRAEVSAVAGGADNLRTVLDWANTNADAATVRTYNDAIDSGNVSLVKLATQGLVAAHEAAVGKSGTRVTGEGAAPAADGAPFESNAEMVAAINDPRYAKDQAYRNKVRSRLANTDLFGR